MQSICTCDPDNNKQKQMANGTTETYTNDDGDKLTEIKVGSTAVKSFTYVGAGRTTQIGHFIYDDLFVFRGVSSWQDKVGTTTDK